MEKLTKQEIYAYVMMLVLSVMVLITMVQTEEDKNCYVEEYKKIQQEKIELIKENKEIKDKLRVWEDKNTSEIEVICEE